MLRRAATTLAGTLPARAAFNLLQKRLRGYSAPDGYERIALSKAIGFFTLADRSVVTTLRNGLRVRVNTDDHVGRILHVMGDYQPKVSWAIRQLLDPGDVVVDIGANVGWFVATAAPLVGRSGHVHAFEPQPVIASMLRETIALNALDQVTLHEAALSDLDVDMELHVLKGNAGAGRLGDPRDPGDWKSFTVKTRNAVAALSELGIERLRMVKIDVEGHEGTVLRVCQPAFSRMPADIVLFESNHEAEPFLQRESVRALMEVGYRIFQFAAPANRIRIVEVGPTGEGTGFSNDFIALHDGPRLADDLRRLGVHAEDLARAA